MREMNSLQRSAIALAALAAVAWTMVAYSVAETTTQPPQTVPEAGGSGGSGEPLSQKLDRAGGVIKPPAGIDPGLSKSPPQSGRTPTIPPPGTSGGDGAINPK
jgi:hypothetical protein